VTTLAVDPDEDEDEGAEISPRAIPVVLGNYKAAPVANGSHRIVWVWACGITSLFCAVIGTVVLIAWNHQNTTNRAVAAELKTLAIAVAKLEATVAARGSP
jgi:hypothetical protein